MHDTCEKYKILIVKHTDGQLSPAEESELKNHIKTCADCREDLEEQTSWKGVSETMKNQLLPDMAWDEYWQHLYNKLERGISWILISIGAILLIGFAVIRFLAEILNSTDISTFEKVGILTLTFGFVILFVSVVREKLMARKHDKYREVQR